MSNGNYIYSASIPSELFGSEASVSFRLILILNILLALLIMSL